MNESTAGAQENVLSAGDWAMAVISFFLTPIVTIGLAIYNFTRSRKSQGALYIGVFAAQTVAWLILVNR